MDWLIVFTYDIYQTYAFQNFFVNINKIDYCIKTQSQKRFFLFINP